MKSLQKNSFIALAVLCVALWGCASTNDDTIEPVDTAGNTAVTNPNSGYVSGSSIGDPSSGATVTSIEQPASVNAEGGSAAGTALNQNTTHMSDNSAVSVGTSFTTPSSNTTGVSGTSGTSVTGSTDTTATISGSGTVTGTTSLNTTTSTTSATTGSTDTMTSSSSLNDQEDTTTTTTTTTRTRMRKD